MFETNPTQHITKYHPSYFQGWRLIGGCHGYLQEVPRMLCIEESQCNLLEEGEETSVWGHGIFVSAEMFALTCNKYIFMGTTISTLKCTADLLLAGMQFCSLKVTLASSQV